MVRTLARPLAGSLALVASLLPFDAAAQAVDLGRGEVPVTVPAGYDTATLAPLIVQLHGYTSSGVVHDRYTGIGALADAYGFISIAPDGTREVGENRNSFWNASDACCNFGGSTVDDVGYVMSLIDEVSSRWSVDPDRIFLVGHSNGGFMSYRIAYEHPDRIAAIVSLAGATAAGPRPAPGAPVNVLQIHGTDDRTIAYAGGALGADDTRYPGAMASVRQWARYNGCEGAGAAREMRDLDASLPGHESGTLVFESGCAPGGSVALWTISDGGHSPVLSDTYAEQVVEWLLAHPRR